MEIAMIVVIVADQNCIKGGQIVKRYSGSVNPSWAGPGERACPLAVDGIDQHVSKAGLKQEAGVIDPSGGKCAVRWS